VLRCALRAHREAQAGRGSGYDVATVACGGLVCWRPPRTPDDDGEARQVAWPDGLLVSAAFSGRGARTTDLLGRVARIGAADGPALAAELARLGQAARGLVDAFAAAKLEELARCVRECHARLAAWDRQHRIGILTPEVARLIAIAEDAGAAAKISGAGGGDSVLAFDDDPQRLAAVARGWEREGFALLPVTRSAVGLHRAP
jgi:phosphomevalonate kinase